MTAAVVADTTVWSNFAHAGDPRLVERAFGSVASPPAVRDELAEGLRLGRLPEVDWSFVGILDLSDRERRRAGELRSKLGAGEAECIAVASLRGVLLLSDDQSARRTARELGVAVSGTLGVLARLVESGHLSPGEADGLLARMIEAGYRSPVSSVSELL